MFGNILLLPWTMAAGQVGEGAGGASLPLADTRPSPEFYKHFHTRKYLG